MVLIDKNELLEGLKELKQNLSASPIVVVEDVESLMKSLEVKEVDLEDAVEDAKDMAKRDIAWNVHVMISEGKSIAEIDHYVCGICDF
jgi:hypothetical protein